MAYNKIFLSLFFVSLSLFGCAPKAAIERDQAIIDQLVASHKNEIDQCYFEELKANPQLGSGEIILRVDQLPTGDFARPRRLKGFSGADPVIQCIGKIVVNWKGPPPYTRGPVDLVWNFQR